MTALDRPQIIDDLRAFLVKRFPKKDGLALLEDDQDLQAAGIDSLDTIEFINHVEATYAIKTDRFEGSYFDTLGRIADLIISKRS